MKARSILALIAAAGAASPAFAQSFSPAETKLLMQPTAIGPAPGGFTAPATSKNKPTAKTQGQAKAVQPVGTSLSAELNSQPSPRNAPALGGDNPNAAQKKPLGDRLPFGPLSLGLQADTSPRSDAMATPTPAGIDQYKKDRIEPYVGVSIIDIKR